MDGQKLEVLSKELEDSLPAFELKGGNGIVATSIRHIRSYRVVRPSSCAPLCRQPPRLERRGPGPKAVFNDYVSISAY